MQLTIEITEEEFNALRALWSNAEKVDWAAYDRFKLRILMLPEVQQRLAGDNPSEIPITRPTQGATNGRSEAPN